MSMESGTPYFTSFQCLYCVIFKFSWEKNVVVVVNLKNSGKRETYTVYIWCYPTFDVYPGESNKPQQDASRTGLAQAVITGRFDHQVATGMHVGINLLTRCWLRGDIKLIEQII